MPFRKMEREIELVKAVSLALDAKEISIPIMRSLLTMLEKNGQHAKVDIRKCYDLKNAQGQSNMFLEYDGKVPLEVLRIIGNKLFDKKEKLDSYDTYGIQMTGFEMLLAKAQVRGVDNRGYQKIYTTVANELAKHMLEEMLKNSGIMIRN